jgi:hypothetical protein
VITRDRRIRYRPAERLAWIQHRVRGLVLTGKKSQSTAQSRSVLEKHWAAIGALADDPAEGPWMMSVTESGLRRLELG